MTNTDELAIQHYASSDPQFQDEDAVDKDLLINRLQETYDILDDAMDALTKVFDVYDSRTLRRVRNLLIEAQCYIEEEM